MSNESLDMLRALLAPVGDKRKTVYCILRHVSASGMSRRISFVVMEPGGNGRDMYIRDITWHVGNVLGLRERNGTTGLHVSGCGMDMGFHVVSNLGHRLWPQGTLEAHSYRNGDPDKVGDYAIKHAWL